LDTSLEIKAGLKLKQGGYKLVIAESCTGGLIGHRITNIPGSSDYYLGSVTAYAYEAKERILGVPKTLLEKHGAVSRETVLEMARGVRTLFAGMFSIETIIGLAVSGIAGPGGALPNKPVGLVWIGMSAPAGEWAWKYIWQGDRLQNKEYSADAVLLRLLDYLDNQPTGKNDHFTTHSK
jgi:PncC family amidohydrolase